MFQPRCRPFQQPLLTGDVGARYADHVAAVIRWPNASVRLAAVEAGDLAVAGCIP